MSDAADTITVYISVESREGRLVVDGSMALWRELLESLRSGDDRPAGRDERHPEPAVR